MKFLDHVSTAQSNLRRSKLRTSLTIIAIVIGSFTFALSLGLGEGVRSYINSQIGRYEDANLYSVSKEGAQPTGPAFSVAEPEVYDPEADKAVTDLSQIFMTEQEVQKAFSSEGVDKAYKPYSFVLEYAYGPSGDKFNATGATTYTEFAKTVTAGSGDLAQTDSSGIVISSKYVEALGFTSAAAAINQPLVVSYKDLQGAVKERTYTVKGVIEPGIFDTAFNFSEAGAKIISVDQKGLLAESFAEVYVSKTEAVDEATFKHKMLDNGFDAQSIKDAVGTLNSIIDAMQIGLGAFSSIAILAAIVGVVNTLFMSVLERTREIGLLRSIGASKKTIFTMFSVEALLIGFWGSLIGLVVANLAALGINRYAAETFLKGVDNFQLLGITWQLHVIIIASISVISLIAGLIPAFKASRLNPIEALKYE